MKKILFAIFILMTSISYCKESIWSVTSKNPIVIVYKVLDPLVVTVEQPEKIVVPAGVTTFKYSEYSKNKKKLNVRVKSSYTGHVDNILRKIYERVHFELQNGGMFDLIHEKEKSKKIIGKGYFVDGGLAPEGEKKTYYNKEFSNNLVVDSFNASTQIDVEFNKEATLPMGIYTGTLKLNVWFNGSI